MTNTGNNQPAVPQRPRPSDALERAAADALTAEDATRWLHGNGPAPALRHGKDERGRFVQTKGGARAQKRRDRDDLDRWSIRHARNIARAVSGGVHGVVVELAWMVGDPRREQSYRVDAYAENERAPRVRIRRIRRGRNRGPSIYERVHRNAQTRAGARALARALLRQMHRG